MFQNFLELCYLIEVQDIDGVPVVELNQKNFGTFRVVTGEPPGTTANFGTNFSVVSGVW